MDRQRLNLDVKRQTVKNVVAPDIAPSGSLDQYIAKLIDIRDRTKGKHLVFDNDYDGGFDLVEIVTETDEVYKARVKEVIRKYEESSASDLAIANELKAQLNG